MLAGKIEQYIRRFRLLQDGDKVLVAVSGGPDSLCLLHVLRTLSPLFNLELIVGHLNHRFRSEAKEEAAMVAALAAAWGIPYEGAAANVASFAARHRLTAQEAARIVRYRFLLAAARKHGANKIAVGHHLDDQVETVLFNLLRGTGPDGLSGMKPARRIGSIELIRPLLAVTRREIEDYCRSRQLNPAIDASNLKTGYSRNKIRLELIPYLEKNYNPAIKEALERLAALAAADRVYLEKATRKSLASLACYTSASLILDCFRLTRLPEALRGRVIRFALERFVSRKQISWHHIRQLALLVETTGPARELQLPGGARAYRSYNRLIITRQPRDGLQPLAELPLPVPGEVSMPFRGTITASLKTLDQLIWPPQPEQAYLDYDMVTMPLAVRTRRSGDRFHPQGAPGAKKLKCFYIDHKVPSHRRDYLPLVVSPDMVVWVAGLRIAHPCRVTEGTRRVLVLEWNSKK